MPDLPGDEDEEFTELHSARFSRVDLVGAPANGSTSFLVMKQDAEGGLLEPDFVRDLIAKAEPEPARERVVTSNGITLNGSPADIAAFIHKASQRAEPDDVAKAKNDTADRKHKAATGAAMSDGCLSAETLVATKRGPRRIDSLVGACEVLTDAGWTQAEIQSFGVKPLLAVTLVSGAASRTVYATAGHRWMLADGEWKLTGDLVVGDHIPHVEVLSEGVQAAELNSAEGHVACHAEKAADNAGRVVMVNLERGPRSPRAVVGARGFGDLAADRTATALLDHESVELGLSDSVLPLEMSLASPHPSLVGELDPIIAGLGAYPHAVAALGSPVLSPVVPSEVEVGVRALGAADAADDGSFVFGGLASHVLARRGPVLVPPLLEVVATAESLGTVPLSAIGNVANPHASYPTQSQVWEVAQVADTPRVEEVFCAVVPDLHRFVLASGVLTGNSYPIASEADLTKAIHAVGRGGDSHNAIRKHIISRAKSLGASSKIPDNWAADGSLKEASVSKTEAVAKDMGPDLDDGIDGMDPTVPLAEPDEMGAGDPTDPGSPAWESIDAATAQKWTSILARARVAVDLLSEREMLEAASADPDDACNAMDLQDVCCAIDYAIGVLAPFAVAEQSEADCGEADMMAAVGKSAGTDPAVFAQVAKAMATDLSLPLQQLEYFGAVVAKSGRVLSSVNEAHIREAHARLNTVLSSLPQAPTADDGQPVAKEQENAVDATEVAKADSAEAQAKNSGPVADGQVPGMGAIPGRPANETMDTPSGRKVLKSAVFDQSRSLLGLIDPDRITQVVKADGDGGKPAQVAVYDADGNLVGVANPDDITPLANVKAPASDDPSPDGAEAAPAPDPADMTPAPAAETGAPADAVDPDDVAKSGELTLSATSHLISPGALESIIAKAVAAALGAQAPAQDIAKQADVAGLSEQVETLKARLATVEEQPAAPKVFTNGAVPPAHQMRGQDQGAPGQVDVAKALDLKHKMYTADPGEAKQIHDDLQQLAIDQLAAIHRR